MRETANGVIVYRRDKKSTVNRKLDTL